MLQLFHTILLIVRSIPVQTSKSTSQYGNLEVKAKIIIKNYWNKINLGNTISKGPSNISKEQVVTINKT